MQIQMNLDMAVSMTVPNQVDEQKFVICSPRYEIHGHKQAEQFKKSGLSCMSLKGEVDVQALNDLTDQIIDGLQTGVYDSPRTPGSSFLVSFQSPSPLNTAFVAFHEKHQEDPAAALRGTKQLEKDRHLLLNRGPRIYGVIRSGLIDGESARCSVE